MALKSARSARSDRQHKPRNLSEEDEIKVFVKEHITLQIIRFLFKNKLEESILPICFTGQSKYRLASFAELMKLDLSINDFVGEISPLWPTMEASGT